MGWKIENNRLVRTFETDSFSEIIEKLNTLTIYANEKNHHPDFRVFEFRKIRFELWTHDVNAVTEADYKMANMIDSLFD